MCKISPVMLSKKKQDRNVKITHGSNYVKQIQLHNESMFKSKTYINVVDVDGRDNRELIFIFKFFFKCI